MTFRYARYTTDLKRIEKFYTTIVGLEKLGEFQNHDHYDGVFLGLKDQSWHLEFTVSDDLPVSKFDEDDILVFYVSTEIELTAIRKRITDNAIIIETPKNPYWQKFGLQIADPDGYKIIFTISHLKLNSKDNLTQLVREKSIENWNDLIEFTRKLPYGRNLNREDFSFVLREMKGTCSSKHSFLKKIADLNEIPNVRLILGIYKMNHLNTPAIQSTITDGGLQYIPEAHCYLKINHQRFDLTTENSDINNLLDDIIEEIEILPEQVNTFKVDFHKEYLKKWMMENAVHKSFEEIWEIRELCIQKLEN